MSGKSHTRAFVVRYILAAAVLALFAPAVAHADTIIENKGGVAGTPTGGINPGPFSLTGSTVFDINGVGVSGTLAFTTGGYLGGSLAAGGAMWSDAGSSFTVTEGGSTVFTGAFTGNVTWTLDGTCTAKTTCTYTLNGNITGTYNGRAVTGATAQINMTTARGPYTGGIVNSKGNDILKDLTGTTAVQGTVPEPGTLALMGTGLLSLAGAIKRKIKLG